MQRPIALTMGDPAGIAGEIAHAAWTALRGELAFYMIADPDWLAALGAPVVRIDGAADAAAAMARGIPVLAEPLAAPVRLGAPDPAHAPAVLRSITRAVADVQAGRAGAICTSPISKAVLAAGTAFPFPGHTELLATLAGGMQPVMMLAGPGLRVVPATIHIPLAEVPRALTPEHLAGVIRITDAALRQDFGLDRPRIAVSGLNPHAGEAGRMGTEDGVLIAPLIARLAAEGLAVTGPHPADTLFHPRARATYDVAVCMYHDQALIPIKTLFFDEGVNVTLGLPFVRTSPDHGTAFDIAGRGIARPDSLIAALRLAATLVRRRG